MQEKTAVDSYTQIGKNTQHKEVERVKYFRKNSIKNSFTVEPDNNTIAEILWIKLKSKRQGNLIKGVFYEKQQSRHCLKELEEQYKEIQKSIFSYTSTNNKIILVGNFSGKIGNDKNEIINGDTSITTNNRRTRSVVRTLN